MGLVGSYTAHGPVLEMPAGPLPGIYDPPGPGRMLFGSSPRWAETERESIREAIPEGLDAAARKGKHVGWLPSSPTTCCTPCCGAGRWTCVSPER